VCFSGDHRRTSLRSPFDCDSPPQQPIVIPSESRCALHRDDEESAVVPHSADLQVGNSLFFCVILSEAKDLASTKTSEMPVKPACLPS
jgi:hypothetical protein